jgi:hypothetical protein
VRAILRTMQAILVTLLVAGLPAVARAQDDDDDAGGGKPAAAPAASTASATEDPNATHWGVGLRLRYTFIPTSEIELFVERAEGGHHHPGFGLEAIRRKGEFEIALGVEYENLTGRPGFWIDRNNTIPTDEPDVVEFTGGDAFEGFGGGKVPGPAFSWISFDTNFIWNSRITDLIAIRYGAGLGIGIIRGDVLRSDARCTGSDIATCQPYNMERRPEGDIPAVFPVVNVLFGTQIHPVKNLAINIEAGMHTLWYFGTTVAYFF